MTGSHHSSILTENYHRRKTTDKTKAGEGQSGSPKDGFSQVGGQSVLFSTPHTE